VVFFVRQERQQLEERLNAIESKQRQLEAQDKLISEALTSTSHASVAERLQFANNGSVSDMPSYRIPGARLGYSEYPIVSEHPSGTQLSSSSSTNVASLRPVFIPPISSYHSRLNAEEIVESVIKPGMENGLPLEPDRVKTSTDGEVHTSRVREYHNELLQGKQTGCQHALLEARRRLQMRAEQLLDSGLNFLSESPRHKRRTVNHRQSLTALSDRQHSYDVENRGFASLLGNDLLHTENNFVLQTGVAVTEPYRPELYQAKCLSEDVERFEYSVAVASPIENDTDDERQFLTPELREDGRVQPYRIAEYSPSPSPHVNDIAANHSQQPSVSHDRNDMDDFSSLIIQAQRDLSVRQRQMQDQLEALENEERRLAEQQLHIGSQLANLPPNIPTFSTLTESTTVSKPYVSSSTAYPSFSAQSTPAVSRDNIMCRDGIDTSTLGLKSGQNDDMAVDKSSPHTVMHQTKESYSAPQLQSHDEHSVMAITSKQLSPSNLSPVSTDVCLCLILQLYVF